MHRERPPHLRLVGSNESPERPELTSEPATLDRLRTKRLLLDLVHHAADHRGQMAILQMKHDMPADVMNEVRRLHQVMVETLTRGLDELGVTKQEWDNFRGVGE